MISLPPALAPWATQLSLFPPELAVSLGGCVQRLALAFGPLRARDGAGQDDPDGYGGLSRRGSYERLLVSEWLLADEAPDEFARRAATNEHAFYALSYRRPAASRRSVALFDAGPDQLGTPRIAHLAALVALARRASEGRVAFAWGVLQDEREELFDEVGKARALLLARTARPANAEDLERWLERLGSPRAEDDLWLVGASRLNGPPLFSRVRVEDVLSPGARSVHVEVLPARRAKREVTLELPPADDCVRLLRDPFKVAKVRPSPPPQGKPTHLRYERNRLFVFDDRGGFDVHVVPHSPLEPPARVRTFYPGQHELLIAGGIHRKALFGITDNPESRRLTLRGRFGTHELERPSEFSRTRVPESAHLVPWPPEETRLVFVDGAGTLFLCVPPWRQVIVGAGSIVATCLYNRRLFFAQDIGETQELGAWRRRVAVLGSTSEVPLPPEAFNGPGPLAAFFGPSNDPMVPAVAVSVNPVWLWTLLSTDGIETIPVLGGGSVVGVTRLFTPSPRTALVVLEGDGKTISAQAYAFYMPLVVAREPIVQVSAGLDDMGIAYLTASGEVVVYSHSRRQNLLRILPEAQP